MSPSLPHPDFAQGSSIPQPSPMGYHQGSFVASSPYPNPSHFPPSMTHSYSRGSSSGSGHNPTSNANDYSSVYPNAQYLPFQQPPPPTHYHTDPSLDTSRKIPAGMVGSAAGWSEDAPRSAPPSTSTSGSGSVAASSSRKLAAQRARTAKSCSACRKRKIACDRVSPCTPCTERKESHLCVWDDGAPLFAIRSDDEAIALKEQVDRLQNFIDIILASQPRSALPGSVSIQPVSHVSTASPSVAPSPSGTHISSLDVTPRKWSIPNSSISAADGLAMDLRANDVPEAFAQVSLDGTVAVERAGERGMLPPSLADATLEDLLQKARVRANDGFVSSTSSAGITALLSAGGDSVSLPDLLNELPSVEQSRAAFGHYFTSFSGHSLPIPRSYFDFQFQQLQRDQVDRRLTNPFFFATFLAICSSGIMCMQDEEAIQLGFPGARDAVAHRWMNAAQKALQAAQFIQLPNLESVRATTIMAKFYIVLSGDDNAATGLTLLALTTQAAMSLALHRDPNRFASASLSPLEIEDHRRVFWSLFCLSLEAASTFGRSWTGFDFNQIDCSLPRDCFDAELLLEESQLSSNLRQRTTGAFVETPTTALLIECRIRVLGKKISDLAYSSRPADYSMIISLDKELRDVEDSFPQAYRMGFEDDLPENPSATQLRAACLNVALAVEFLRLHRPWLTASNQTYQPSRAATVKNARLLCNLGAQVHIHQYVNISAASALALESIQSHDTNTRSHLAEIARDVADDLEQNDSVLCHRGALVLRFLLEIGPGDSNPAKRLRGSSGRGRGTGVGEGEEPVLKHKTWKPTPISRPTLNPRQPGTAGQIPQASRTMAPARSFSDADIPVQEVISPSRQQFAPARSSSAYSLPPVAHSYTGPTGEYPPTAPFEPDPIFLESNRAMMLYGASAQQDFYNSDRSPPQ
ncbi:hypothetical protein T439DRAFT_356183 [Meredithblackwellia eburnea MCA 4105]